MGTISPPPGHAPKAQPPNRTLPLLAAGLAALLVLALAGVYCRGKKSAPMPVAGTAPGAVAKSPDAVAAGKEAAEVLEQYLKACSVSDDKTALALSPGSKSTPVLFSYKVVRADGCAAAAGKSEDLRDDWARAYHSARSRRGQMPSGASIGRQSQQLIRKEGICDTSEKKMLPPLMQPPDGPQRPPDGAA